MFLFKTGCTDPGFIPRARPDEAAYNQTLGDEGFIELLVWHSFYLYIYLSLCLSIYPSMHLYLSIYMYMSIYLHVHVPIYLCVTLSIYMYLSIHLYSYIYMTIYLHVPIYLCITLFIYLSINPFIYMTIYLHVPNSGREIRLQHLVSNSVTSTHHSTTSMHCHVKIWCSLS